MLEFIKIKVMENIGFIESKIQNRRTKHSHTFIIESKLDSIIKKLFALLIIVTFSNALLAAAVTTTPNETFADEAAALDSNNTDKNATKSNDLQNANDLESEFNKLSSTKIPSTIQAPDENVVNAKSVEVQEKDGMLQSSEQEVIDLYGNTQVQEKVDFSHCAAYYKQASVSLGNNLYAIRLKTPSGTALVGYNPTRPNIKNLAKFDPFIGLFEVRENIASKYAYEMADIDDYALSKELASTGIKGAKVGRFEEHQKGFLIPAKFSVATQKNGVISNICYRIYGLSTGGDGFIEKRYIDRFLSQDKPYYGDIGVRFQETIPSSATFVVQFADPFFPNNPFKRGDVLISINDYAPRDWGDLEWQVANLEQGSVANVKIRRGEMLKNLEVKVGRRYGGMLLPDSFLERFNFDISSDFVVQKAPSQGAFSKLRKGDRILFINNIDLRQLKVANTAQKNELLRELFTRLQNNQVDFLESKKLSSKKANKYGSKDILEQFQSKDSTQNRQNSFYRKMSENMDEFINAESNKRAQLPTLSADTSGQNDLHSFSGDGILRDSGTQSMRTIYDMYDSGTEAVKPTRDKIKNYEELEEYGGNMNFLIDRQGFQFRVPLE